MSISTPVAFLIFNRPDLTDIVFEAIRQVQPQKLLVVADGPRFPQEVEKCKNTRSIIDRVDWDCEILTNFSDRNLGCKVRVSSGLNWVFSIVEEAIILEDDCLPAPSFFSFCQNLLEYYRDDKRIMMVSGNNFQAGQSRTPYSYFFSKYPSVWGWASWRRAWQYFDVEMKSWPEYQKMGFINFMCEDTYEDKYWTDIFEQTYNGEIDTWDYQWYYACWSQYGLAIVPDVNMVSNLGFDRTDATHTPYDAPYARLPTTDILDINYPPFVVKHREADNYTFNYRFGGKHMKEADTWAFKIRWHLARMKSQVINKLKQYSIF